MTIIDRSKTGSLAVFIVLFSTLFSLKIVAENTESETEVLYKRLYSDYLQATETDTLNYKTQLSNGSWTDINYTSRIVTFWPPMQHLYRLHRMAGLFCNQQDKNSALAVKLLAGIKAGIAYWQLKKPVSDNWFYNDIGKQLEFIQIMILMRDYLPVATINEICNYCVIANANNTGANLLEMATSTAVRGVLQNNSDMIRISLDLIKTVIVPVDKGKDGIQADNSFLFHGLQLFSTLYNVSIMRGAAFWLDMTNGLSFELPQQIQNGIRNAILESDRWFYYGDIADFGTVGRRMSQQNGTRTSDILPTLKRLAGIDSLNADAYKLMIANIEQNKHDTLNGNRHFYRADCMVQRNPTFYFSVKMCSSRTSGTESGNGENLKGFWLPFGANCLLKSGNEFKTTFPLWDWTKVPGVTCPEEVPSFGWSINQPSEFVGGVSNGKIGICSMQLNKQSTIARKSWFVFEDEIVALGAGITSTNTKPITTSLAQNKMVGKVFVNGVVVKSGEKIEYSNVSTVYNDSTAYYFPLASKVSITNTLKSGNWYQINNSQPDLVVKDSVFSVWLTHGIKPVDSTYAYIILPKTSLQKLTSYTTNSTVKILKNTLTVQAATHTAKKLTGAVFHAGGQVVLENGIIIKAFQPCALLVDASSDSLIMYVSDPSQNSEIATFQIVYNSTQRELVDVKLPGGNFSGSTVKFSRKPMSLTDKTSISESKSISLHYNKALKKLFVNGTNGFSNIKIFSSGGQEVIGCNYCDEIDVSGLKHGFYVVKYGNFTDKLIK